MSSLVPAVLDALVAGFDTALSIPVVDGPPTTNVENTSLFVGCDPDLTGHSGTISGEQRWAGKTRTDRDETFEVPCVLYYLTGDDDLSAARLAVQAHMDLVETWLRSNISLGQPGASNCRAEFGTPFSWIWERSGKGTEVRYVFTVNVEGRI